MSVIQISNYLVPIITIPYLVRTLGFSSYGLMTLTQMIIGYFEQFMTYSFSLTAPKAIAQDSDDSKKVNHIFHTIIYTKIVLFLFCLLILGILVLAVPFFWTLRTIIFAGLSILLANLLQIDWFFQGIQQMKNITYINLLGRFLSLVLLFVLVHSPEDAIGGLLSVTISQIIAGVLGWILAYRKFGLQLTRPDYAAIKNQLQSGFNVFSSQFLVRFYSAEGNIAILGFWANTTIIGTYALANRIFAFIVNTAIPINTALYPYLAQLYAVDYTRYRKEFRRIGQLYFVAYSLFALILFLTADWLILLIAKTPNNDAALILKILSSAIIISPFGALYTQNLIIHQKVKYLLLICIIAIVVNLATLIPAFYYFQGVGLAINNVIVYWVIFFMPIIIMKRLKIV